jgi:hypothetical protein
MGNLKREGNVECESGEEMDVLSKEQHVFLPAAFAKTTFSNSIVPLSTRLTKGIPSECCDFASSTIAFRHSVSSIFIK